MVHTVRHRGQAIGIDHVPVEVDAVCGDMLVKPDSVRRIERLLEGAGQPTRTVPLYEYA